MPYKEIDHTADWCIEVKGSDLPSLFSESARGMNALAGMVLKPAPEVEKTWSAVLPDYESLLVAFLSELIYWLEQDHVGFNDYCLSFNDLKGQVSLSAFLKGAPIASLEKQVKAVTFHDLRISRKGRWYQTRITFDV